VPSSGGPRRQDGTRPQDGKRRRILLKDVASRANVSGSTASRALADDKRISAATRLVVKAAAADLHYVPDAAARSLRVRRTRTLGLLLPDLRDPVHGQVASAFEQEARQQGYSVMMVAGERDLVRERLAMRIFAEHVTDGVAVVSGVLTPKELRERVDPDRLVLVWPDHRSLPRRDGPRVPGVIQTNDASGVRAAVNHLVDAGSRQIAYAEGGVRASNTIRAETVAATLRNRGVEAPMRRFAAPFDAWRAPGELAAEIAADLPEALVCYDDQLALGLMDALRKLGIRIPDDMGIVGFDGIPFAGISNPRLTTVAVPSAEMGRVAASSLIRAVHEGMLPDGVVLPVEFVVRESTRGVAVPAGQA
jgi:DNA-binding LacI/PurR family transcriptional regulator